MLRKWQRALWVRAFQNSEPDPEGIVLADYAPDEVEIQANVQPETDEAVLKEYGAIKTGLYRAHYTGKHEVHLQDGVSFTPGLDKPEFEIVALAPWRSGYTEITLKRR